ncbi:YesL family protein [Gracilibacillus sp. S3-1-1]|uniref:YesL family protein n=1 Tax=Gracilibacillus pellucidus TaxID=3095368 RepID=A0ACC6M3F2_9BACI|nr:YesL family protein [Gracilibacillus sp. S3-1-1]MDX8045490.1 YesL family protein [Gracilibacillus sp. S3-1-1]
MNGKSITTTLDKVFRWITNLAFLNVLWVAFTILGLGILGIFPATTAALGVARKWLKGDHEIRIWPTFKQIYREEFKSANILGWILAVVGYLFFLNYQIIHLAEGDLPFIVPFLYYFILFLYITIVIWVFPLLVHNYASIIHQLKNALIIGITKIHITVTLILLLFSMMYFSLEFPVLLVFFTFSLLALVWMWLSLRVFVKIFKE